MGDPIQSHCRSCGESLSGPYCSNCGEKVIQPKRDYSIFAFFVQLLDGITNFDLKLIRSFYFLFARPGQLTKNYIDGRRVKWMRPIQIFLVSSVLFYLIMPNSGSFYASYYELNSGYQASGFSLDNPVKYDINGHLREMVYEKYGADLPDSLLNEKANAIYSQAYGKAPGNSKTYLFLLTPIWGLMLYLLFYKQQAFYVQHLIFAMHIFSFFLLLDALFLFFWFEIMHVAIVENTLHLLPFFIWVLIYIILAVKCFYQTSLMSSVLKGFLAYTGLLTLLILYRVFITYWAIDSI